MPTPEPWSRSCTCRAKGTTGVSVTGVAVDPEALFLAEHEASDVLLSVVWLGEMLAIVLKRDIDGVVGGPLLVDEMRWSWPSTTSKERSVPMPAAARVAWSVCQMTVRRSARRIRSARVARSDEDSPSSC